MNLRLWAVTPSSNRGGWGNSAFLFFYLWRCKYVIEIDLGTLEYYDEESNEFQYETGGTVQFEYSLKTMYEWEAKWGKAFLRGDYTTNELKDFFLRMALSPVDGKFLTHEVMEELSEYLTNKNTATTFSEVPSSQNENKSNIGKVYTSEEIYALMFMNQIPLEFESRNLNRLLVILRVINDYSQPKKKMTTTDIYDQNRRLNEERKKKYGTKG